MATRWDPFRESMSLREAVDRLLADSLIYPHSRSEPGARPQTLPIDMWETNDSLIVRAPMPGAKPDAEDVDISIDRNVLTIRARLPGVANEETEGQGSPEAGRGIRWIHREVPRGEFARTVELPIQVDTDRAEAHFGDGLLLLTLPKAQAARPRRIQVTPS
jgi:HSP20 family protein